MPRDATFAADDRVRIVSLTGAGAEHLVLHTAERAPQQGDVGTVVDVAARLGGVGWHYTVARHDDDGRLLWLAVFAAHELELVIDRSGSP
jgi:hypothetical protein